MNVEHFKEKAARQAEELMAAIARAEQEANRVEPEVGDPTDRAVDGAAADEALQSASTDSETLAQVDEALRRIDARLLRKVRDLRKADRAGAAGSDPLDVRIAWPTSKGWRRSEGLGPSPTL